VSVCDGGDAVCRQLDVSLQQQKSACQRTQLLLMCYQWLNEDVLTSAGHQPSSGPRASLMTDLKKVGHYCARLLHSLCGSS